MKKNKQKKQRTKTSMMVLCFMLVFVPTVGIKLYTQSQALEALKVEEAGLLEKLEREESKGVRLQSQQDYYKSDAYIEQAAREQLGYVKPDEVIFKNNCK